MKAYELLEQKGWTQGASAKDGNGNEVSVHSPKACSFCANGALIKCYPQDNGQYNRIFTELGTTISYWNDHPSRTKLEVITLLKKLDI